MAEPRPAPGIGLPTCTRSAVSAHLLPNVSASPTSRSPERPPESEPSPAYPVGGRSAGSTVRSSAPETWLRPRSVGCSSSRAVPDPCRAGPLGRSGKLVKVLAILDGRAPLENVAVRRCRFLRYFSFRHGSVTSPVGERAHQRPASPRRAGRRRATSRPGRRSAGPVAGTD